jgi:hypothetical protein
MAKTVTPEEALVDLLLAFVNAEAPTDPAAVEAHFRQHPWTTRVPWLTILGDPLEQAVAAFQSDHRFAKKQVARIVRSRGALKLREEMATRLREHLTEDVFGRHGPMRLPLGEVTMRYRGGELVLDFTPFVRGVAAAITWGLALLLDTRREYGRALLQCRVCETIFRRTRSHQTYCSRPCTVDGTRERNRERQHRQRHPEEE